MTQKYMYGARGTISLKQLETVRKYALLIVCASTAFGGITSKCVGYIILYVIL
jgi:hypothetical protein